jgi:HEAT repeat protein
MMSVHSYKSEAQPILDVLAAEGIVVDTFSGLRRLGKKTKRILPLLLLELAKVSNDDLKEDLVRTLSVPWAPKGTDRAFLKEFKRTTNAQLRWAIGNGLSIVASGAVEDELIGLVNDTKYGRSREMAVLGLSRLHSAKAVKTALALLNDDEVEGHAVMALGDMKAKDSIPQIRLRLAHPKTWIRKEARKALRKIERV